MFSVWGNPLSEFTFVGERTGYKATTNKHEVKRHLLLGRKVMTNLDSTLKSKDITLPTKVHLIKDLFFQ